MDLLQTVRKTGSRGGVNFSWDEVASSSRRENYLGHSLMAPVGRWQKGKDLNWYSKSESTSANADETDEERIARERREELRKIKEAEEDALNAALGLPPKIRNTSGANDVEVSNKRQIGPVAEEPESRSKDRDGEDRGKSRRDEDRSRRHGDERRREHRRRHRSRSRSRHRDDDRDRRSRHRSRSRDRRGRTDERSHRERSKDRSRTGGRHDRHRRDRSRDRRRSRSREHRRREASPERGRDDKP